MEGFGTDGAGRGRLRLGAGFRADAGHGVVAVVVFAGASAEGGDRSPTRERWRLHRSGRRRRRGPAGDVLVPGARHDASALPHWKQRSEME